MGDHGRMEYLLINDDMNIGFYRYSLLNRGGDRLSLAYANYLALRGHNVTLYVSHMDTIFDIVSELKVKLLPRKGLFRFLLNAAIHDLGHDAVVVDIVHLHLMLSIRNRVVYYAQADDVEYYDNRLLRAIIDTLYRIHFLCNQPMISMSQHLTDIFSNRYRRVNAKTLLTGIDHQLFYPDPDKELILSKAAKKAIVFMVRGDAHRKGFDLAMRVFDSLEPTVKACIELWVCGGQFSHDKFGFTVRNFGTVSDARLRQILSSADIFFYPSRHEGFGLFPLEAMACGCVAVTTDAIPYASKTPSMMVSPVGDIDSLMENISKIALDDDLIARMKKKAIEDADMYDFEKSKIAFENALKTIVSDHEPCG